MPTSVVAQGGIAGKEIQWEVNLASLGERARPSIRGLSGLRSAALKLREDASLLPLVAYYGTGRLWGEDKTYQGRRTSLTDVDERIEGYRDCLLPSSTFNGIAAWYERRMSELQAPAFKESILSNTAFLEAVRNAASTVLAPTGWHNLRWDTTLGSLVADHRVHGKLPISFLSDGVRNMLALVADVARRCASLNPHLGVETALRTPGVLLIDEVDMHLHPRWQQLIVELLRKAFPSLQLVVSTHSPHVLSTVHNRSIRVIRISDGLAAIRIPTLQTRGVESADVLAAVMDVDPVPQTPEAKDLSIYRGLIEDGRAASASAIELRSKLVRHFGDHHPVILDCDRLIRFQEFRLRRGPER
ncbi:AAA family ATPase [Microvirga sp. RSM25]|uniref:AAA family ATPase n=1 Tax=Microvirga sp. RSM25 TaxID=3273802 RepID=UPI00384FE822